jgi:hypothetical protein
MSSVSIQGDASGTGIFTVASPNSNTNRTLTLPDATGTVVVTGGAQTIEFAAGSASTPSVTFTGDTNTGIYSSGTDAVNFAEGGVGYRVGFRNIPAVGTKTGSYTLATTDVGEYVQVGSGGSITIPNATFAEGDAITIFNNTTGNITITCTITTAYIAGTDSDKATMTLATRGLATILFISSTVCVVSGNVS